jgi:hypothetical protein
LSPERFFEFSGFAGSGQARFLVEYRPILLQFIVICYFELPHQCPTDIKKGLGKLHKPLNLLVGRMRFERMTIALKDRSSNNNIN